MRDHLLALGEIQDALAREQFEGRRDGRAATRHDLAGLHGAHSGTVHAESNGHHRHRMHHAASRFAVAANDAAVADDVKPALAALSDVTRLCVACHSGFRVE